LHAPHAAAQGLHGLHAPHAAAQGLHGLHAPHPAAQGLHGLHAPHPAAHGLHALHAAKIISAALPLRGIAVGFSERGIAVGFTDLVAPDTGSTLPPTATLIPITTGINVPESNFLLSSMLRSLPQNFSLDSPLNIRRGPHNRNAIQVKFL
jgi:hypothetical protein